MTPEEINTNIAVLCGRHQYLGVLRLGHRCSVCNGFYEDEVHNVRNYYGDLNACHEMEKTLVTDTQQDRFLITLVEMTGSDAWRQVHATAAQRSAVFLKVHGETL